MRQSKAMTDGCGDESLPLKDPGQHRLFIGYGFLLDENIQKFFDGLGFILCFKVEDDVGRLYVFTEKGML
jgi:hypothetical protein